MINISSIKIKNFILFDDVDIDLGNNMYFISGENRVESNQISNGAGKTLFCTAFVWCLFEDNLRGMLVDDVIGPHGDYCEVELILDNDGQKIRVYRTRNHPDKGNSVELEVDGKDRAHPTSKRKTTDRILDVLGIPSKSVFYHCAYFDDETDPIVSLTPSELKRTVADILNTQKFDAWLKKVRSVRSDFEDDKQEYKNLLNDVEHIREQTIPYLKDHISDLKNEIKSFDDQIESRKQEVENRISKKREELEKCESVIKDEDELRDKFDEQKKKKENYENRNSKLKRAKKKENKIKKERDRLKNKVSKVENKKQEAEKALNNLNANPSGECNYCGNLLQESDSIEEKRDKFQKEVDKYQSKLVDVKYNLEAKNKELKKHRNKRKNFEDKLGDKQEELKEYFDLKSKLDGVERAKKRKKEIKNKIDNLENRIDELDNKTIDAKKEKLQDKKKRIKTEKAKAEKKEKKAKRLRSEINANIKALNHLENILDSIKTARFNSFIKSFKTAVNNNLKTLTEGNFLCKVVSDDGMLKILFTNSSKNGKFLPWSRFSKGEKKRISKAVFMAMNDVMDLDFMIDDEGVANTDDQGVMDILDFVMSKDKTLLFVSHKKKAKDYCQGVDNIHVIKEQLEDDTVRSRVEVR